MVAIAFESMLELENQRHNEIASMVPNTNSEKRKLFPSIANIWTSNPEVKI